MCTSELLSDGHCAAGSISTTLKGNPISAITNCSKFVNEEKSYKEATEDEGKEEQGKEEDLEEETTNQKDKDETLICTCELSSEANCPAGRLSTTLKGNPTISTIEDSKEEQEEETDLKDKEEAKEDKEQGGEEEKADATKKPDVEAEGTDEKEEEPGTDEDEDKTKEEKERKEYKEELEEVFKKEVARQRATAVVMHHQESMTSSIANPCLEQGPNHA